MKIVNKRDIIFVGVLVVVVIAMTLFWNVLFSKKGNVAKIYHGETLIQEVDLSTGEEYQFSVEGYENIVFQVYADGSIAFIKSDCPDQVCIETGKIFRAGQSAICLPNQIMVVVEGDNSSDFVVG